MIRTLLILSASLFLVCMGILLYWEKEIEEAVWFIPVIAGTLIGFMAFAATFRFFMDGRTPEPVSPLFKKRAALVAKYALGLIGFTLILSSVCGYHYLYFVPSDPLWHEVHTDARYLGKCYTQRISWKPRRVISHARGVECLNTGYDDELEFLFSIIRPLHYRILTPYASPSV